MSRKALPSLVAPVLAAVLAACSPTFSLGVADFSTPISNSLGRICWVRVDGSGAPRISTATYRANAIYDPEGVVVTDRVEIQVFGRREDPGGNCTQGQAEDIPLSEPFELEREQAQAIEVGGASYGEDLADLVRGGSFWLGITAAGNVVAGSEQIAFEDGRITVGF